MSLHPQVKDRLQQISEVVIETQEPAIRIIDKVGPLANPADRDHCLQYMTAIPLIFESPDHGRLRGRGRHATRAWTACAPRWRRGEPRLLTREYYDRNRRHIGNALQVFFTDGSATRRIQVDVPIGHRERRAEGIPKLIDKFTGSVAGYFDARQAASIAALFGQGAALDTLPVNELLAVMVR